MAQNEFIEMLEKVFRGRGYDILTSSLDNSYMLLSKDDERTAVGFSPVGVSMTVGEAEMFLSMAENDSANDMLYLHPSKMKRNARAALKSGDVAMWDRTALAIAIGEAMLLEMENPPPVEESIPEPANWFSGNEDVDPISEVREFEKQIKGDEEVSVGSFQVKKISIGKPEKKELPEEVDPQQAQIVEPEVAPSIDEIPTVSIEPLDMDISTVLEEESIEEMDLSPVLSLFDVMDAPPKKRGRPSKTKVAEAEDRKMVEWRNIPPAGQMVDVDKAISLAGGDPPGNVQSELRPHILYWVRYVMEAEDGKNELAQEKPFLMDCTDGEVMDLTDPLATELTELKGGRQAGDDRVIVTSRIDGPEAVGNVKKKLLDLTIHLDKKVHEGPGSVIYEETRYTLKKRSLEVVRTSKVLMPYLVGTGKDGEPVWAVEAVTGSLKQLK